MMCRQPLSDTGIAHRRAERKRDMATKKTPAQQEEEIIEETAEVKPVDPWKDMVEVFVPRFRKGEDQTLYVNVNGHERYVPLNGKNQLWPRPFAEVIQAHFEQEEKTEDFIDAEMSEKEKRIAEM